MLATKVAPLVVVAASVGALAQAPPPAFRADTRLVQVSVVVRDKQGRAVPGLARGDFTLTEDGAPQEIAFFSGDTDRMAASPAPVLAPGEFTNRLEGRAASAATVILFDRINTPIDDQRHAHAQIVKFLGQTQREDRVALYVLDSNAVRVLHDFTNDSAALIRAFGNQVSRPPLELDTTESEAKGLIGFRQNAVNDMKELTERGRVDTTAAAIQVVAGHLAGIRGRKNLVWVSSGFPITLDGRFGTEVLTTPVQRATRAVNDANVAIYPVDARGVVVNLPPPVIGGQGPTQFQPSAGRTPASTDIPDTPPSVPSRPVNMESLKALADDSGGRAFFNSNDIAAAVRTAIDDGRSAYVISYYPSNAAWNGAFRAIAVKVNRAGVEVRARKGYIAFPLRPASPDAAARTAALLDEVRGPVEATGIGFTARVSRDNASDGSVKITLHLDSGALTLTPSGEKWIGTLDLVIAQHTTAGRWFETEGSSVDADFTAARRDQVTRDGVTFSRTVKLREDAESVHLAVRDAASGATGTLTIPASAIR